MLYSPSCRINHQDKAAFTLVELSIVLVIIGLIIGGVLVGRDLISTSEIRSQISQVEQYKTSVNAFKLKYGYLPGDMPDTAAASFGLTGNGGNGNGRLDGTWQATYEENAFLVQLGQAGLVGGSFSSFDTNTPSTTGSAVARYLPPAKLNGLYIYPWGEDYIGSYYKDGYFYSQQSLFFTVASVPRYCGFNICPGFWESFPTMKVSVAYNIDQKIDDGFPQSGKVLAAYLGYWSGFGGHSAMWAEAGNNNDFPTVATIAASSTTCYDTGGVSGVPKYSVGQNSGNGMNCALSFKFQSQ